MYTLITNKPLTSNRHRGLFVTSIGWSGVADYKSYTLLRLKIPTGLRVHYSSNSAFKYKISATPSKRFLAKGPSQSEGGTLTGTKLFYNICSKKSSRLYRINNCTDHYHTISACRCCATLCHGTSRGEIFI